MDWFRSHHGAPTDPKWLTIARRAKVRPGDVASIVWALLDYASQQEDRGSVAGFDAETLADFYGYEAGEIEAVIVALRDKGVIEGDRFAAWDKRQPRREDGSAERAKAWRERKKNDTNATEREQTQPNADERPDTEERLEGEENPPVAPPVGVARMSGVEARFEEFWAAYPKRGSATNPRKPAFEKFGKLVKAGIDPAEIISGAKAYASAMRHSRKDGTEHVAQAVTFLNQERWKDYSNVEQIEAWRTDPKAWRDDQSPPPWPDAPTGTVCGRWRKSGTSWAFMR